MGSNRIQPDSGTSKIHKQQIASNSQKVKPQEKNRLMTAFKNFFSKD